MVSLYSTRPTIISLMHSMHFKRCVRCNARMVLNKYSGMQPQMSMHIAYVSKEAYVSKLYVLISIPYPILESDMQTNFKIASIGIECYCELTSSPPLQMWPNFLFVPKRCAMLWNVWKNNFIIFLHFFCLSFRYLRDFCEPISETLTSNTRYPVG